jgi:transporter family protein
MLPEIIPHGLTLGYVEDLCTPVGNICCSHRTAGKGVPGNLATAIRTSVVLVLAWGIVLFTGEVRELKQVHSNNLVFLLLSGIATGLSWICYFKALETGDVSKVAPIDKLSVAIAMALAFFILKEPMEWKTILGGLLILSGSIIILL